MPLTFREIFCSFSIFYRTKNSKEFCEIGKVYWTDQKLMSHRKNFDIIILAFFLTVKAGRLNVVLLLLCSSVEELIAIVCGYFVSKIILTFWEKKLVIKKNFWSSRLKIKNLLSFWGHQNNLFITIAHL